MRIQAAIAKQRGGPFVLGGADLDEPRPDEILVRISAVGICHTDLAFKDQDLGLALPAVLGHEGAGTVEKVGSDVTKVSPGDRVLLSFRSCGHCPRCETHDPGYCHQLAGMNFTGRRPDGSTALRDGDQEISSAFFGQSSFASHALAYERNVIKVADDAPLALYAPLGCGVQTGAGAILRSLECKPGRSLVVIGAGTVGLSAVMAARVAGLGPIIVIDPLEARRQAALSCGATDVLDSAADEVGAKVREIVPAGADYAFDTSGHPAAIEQAIGYLGPKGALGLVGVPKDISAVLPLSLALAVGAGLTVRGIIEGDSDPDVFIPDLIALHREGRFPLEQLVTVYPFEQINEAVTDQHHGRVVKAVLSFD
ncbi:NAD(P)-dependent alcohol dehydrogenase [soil metagenome]